MHKSIPIRDIFGTISIYIALVILHILQECNQFQAGSKLRSKIKNKKLDVTGVFGAVCKHEMPLVFLNMHEGERYV